MNLMQCLYCFVVALEMKLAETSKGICDHADGPDVSGLISLCCPHGNKIACRDE